MDEEDEEDLSFDLGMARRRLLTTGRIEAGEKGRREGREEGRGKDREEETHSSCVLCVLCASCAVFCDVCWVLMLTQTSSLFLLFLLFLLFEALSCLIALYGGATDEGQHKAMTAYNQGEHYNNGGGGGGNRISNRNGDEYYDRYLDSPPPLDAVFASRCIHQLQQMMIRDAGGAGGGSSSSSASSASSASSSPFSSSSPSYDSLGAFSSMIEELHINRQNFAQWAVVARLPGWNNDEGRGEAVATASLLQTHVLEAHCWDLLHPRCGVGKAVAGPAVVERALTAQALVAQRACGMLLQVRHQYRDNSLTVL